MKLGLQEKYNLTEKSQKRFGKNSILAHVYLIRANSYALEGNGKRANQFYKAAISIGNEEVRKIANLNKLNVQPIIDIMYSDVELRKLRAKNIQKHAKIENEFERFLKGIGKVLGKIFDVFKKK